MCVVAFLGLFIWLGFSIEDWNRRSQVKLFVLTALVLVAVALLVNVYWLTDTPVWEPRIQ